MKDRGSVDLKEFYDAVGRTSLTWYAVKIAKMYYVDGDRVTKLVSKSGYSVKRIQHILRRVDIEFSDIAKMPESEFAKLPGIAI